MTTIKTRHLRPFECHSTNVDPFLLHITSGDRILEVGDQLIFAGHNGAHVELEVMDRAGGHRWIAVDESLVFICEV